MRPGPCGRRRGRFPQGPAAHPLPQGAGEPGNIVYKRFSHNTTKMPPTTFTPGSTGYSPGPTSGGGKNPLVGGNSSFLLVFGYNAWKNTHRWVFPGRGDPVRGGNGAGSPGKTHRWAKKSRLCSFLGISRGIMPAGGYNRIFRLLGPRYVGADRSFTRPLAAGRILQVAAGRIPQGRDYGRRKPPAGAGGPGGSRAYWRRVSSRSAR